MCSTVKINKAKSGKEQKGGLGKGRFRGRKGKLGRINNGPVDHDSNIIIGLLD